MNTAYPHCDSAGRLRLPRFAEADSASPDLVHWQHLPVALAEESGAMAFSGSAVVDRDTLG